MTVLLAPADDLFRFVRDDHPFAEHVRRAQALVEEAEPYFRLADDPERGALTVRKLLRLSADEPGRLRWLDLSLQRTDADGRFDAATFLYSAAKKQLTCYEFPADPCLVTLPKHASEGRLGSRVLQFVPRQRLAYLTPDGRVGKLMRATDLPLAYDRLRRVHAAVERADVSFDVAAPAGVDLEEGVFFQGFLPGRDAAASLTEANLTELMQEAGAVQAELHGLDVPGVGPWSPQAFVRELESHVELVSLFRPSEGALLQHALVRLVRDRPEPSGFAFCHGDLRCSHLLKHDRAWSVIDFDGCRLGDPYQDIARLLAFLKRDVPLLRERFADPLSRSLLLDEAVAALVDGYEVRAGAVLNGRRLLWYLTAHEPHYLARMFKRDLYDLVSFERGVERVLELARRARREPVKAVAFGGRR